MTELVNAGIIFKIEKIIIFIGIMMTEEETLYFLQWIEGYWTNGIQCFVYVYFQS